jgi:hypothetical protein
LYLEQVLHSEYGRVLEGPSSAPAAIAPVGPLGFPPVFFTNVFVTAPGVKSATGARGDIAVVDRPDTLGSTSITVRPAGSTTWSHEQLTPGAPATEYSDSPKALAVDGLGDTTVLVNTVTYPKLTEIASAYFAPPGAPFAPLAVPGNYFTAIASDAVGRSAIAGYASSGADGAGLYLSRRESPSGPFGPAILLSVRRRIAGRRGAARG